MASAQLVINSTTGFIPNITECVTLKNTLCADPLCLGVDTTVGAYVLNDIGAASIDVGMDPNFAPLWSQMAYVVTNVIMADYGGMDQIYPALNAVYECEARNSGLIWANYLGVWSATQTCRDDAACVTAWTNIRTNTIAGTMDLGTKQDDGAIWMHIPAIDWYVPDPSNTDAQFCNMVFAALEEENAKATYILVSMTALWFTAERQASILAFCNKDMEDFVVGVVTTHVVKSILIFTFVGLAVGSFFTGVGCWCCNRKSKAVNGV